MQKTKRLQSAKQHHSSWLDAHKTATGTIRVKGETSKQIEFFLDVYNDKPDDKLYMLSLRVGGKNGATFNDDIPKETFDALSRVLGGKFQKYVERNV